MNRSPTEVQMDTAATLAALREENDLLRGEIRVARRAAEVANELVAQQFVEVERILRLLEAENALRKGILDAATRLSIIYTDLDGTIRLFNRGAERMLGYGAGEMVGRNLRDLHPPQACSADGQPLAGFCACQRLKANGVGDTVEAVYLGKDGGSVPVSLSVTRVRDSEGAEVGILCAAMDISEAKRHEAELRQKNEEQQRLLHELQTTHQQLVQSEKLASLGQLAAGVAHEINNPISFVNSNLTTLRGYVDNLLGVIGAFEKVEGELRLESRQAVGVAKLGAELDYVRSDVTALLAESVEGIGRVKGIVEDLKNFSHMGELSWQWMDLHAGLDSTLNVVWNEIKYKADLHKEYGTIPQVRCVSAQINQVFMNLLVNAAQAIDQHGRITITTRQEGDGVAVVIADTGTGIAPEHLPRIFDPFFTTKPVGAGTGLGLYISFGIIQKHGGRIDVSSEPGTGTAFTVWLPKEPPADAEPSPGGH